MLDRAGFDLWAGGYDKSVGLSEEENSYPFAGYRAVLDLGLGTGVLAARLYGDGCRIWGVDFSENMLSAARAKMPEARLLCRDFSRGLPPEWEDERFDYVVCTYALHHLTDREKPALLRDALRHLAPGGSVLVGDVAFESRAELERCRADWRELWDEEECYPVAETLRQEFPNLRFEPQSFCAGVFILEKK